MTRDELVRELMKYPSDVKVLLANDLGASELDSNEINFEELDYVKYEYKGRIYYNWEHRDVYPRDIIQTEKVIVIS